MKKAKAAHEKRTPQDQTLEDSHLQTPNLWVNRPTSSFWLSSFKSSTGVPRHPGNKGNWSLMNPMNSSLTELMSIISVCWLCSDTMCCPVLLNLTQNSVGCFHSLCRSSHIPITSYHNKKAMQIDIHSDFKKLQQENSVHLTLQWKKWLSFLLFVY